MLQKTKVPPGIQMNEGSLRALAHPQLGRLVRPLSRTLGLPDDWISFFMFLVVLSVLSVGLLLHIHLSAQILQIKLQIGQLERAYQEVEYQNSELIWQISQSTAIEDVRRRAEALGYVSDTQPYYVAATEIAPVAELATELGQVALHAQTVQLSDSATASSAAPIASDFVSQPAFSGASRAVSGGSGPLQQRIHSIGNWIQRWWQE